MPCIVPVGSEHPLSLLHQAASLNFRRRKRARWGGQGRRFGLFSSPYLASLSDFMEAVMSNAPPNSTHSHSRQLSSVIVLNIPTMPWSWHPYCCPILWGGGHMEGAATSGKEPGLLCVFFPLCHANLHRWAKDLPTSEHTKVSLSC